jgi:hypothetical protein
MGTKQLQADKRVAEVTLNEAGKAATLTLAPGWTFNGSSGPFTLKNVEHGHQIVRGAVNPDAKRAPRAPRATPSPQGPQGRGAATQPSIDRPDAPPAPLKPRGDVIIVYRTKLVSDKAEITGWLKVTDEANPKTKAELLKRVTSQLRSYIKVGKLEDYRPEAKRWTNRDQALARQNDGNGCPWGIENHGD